VGLSQAGLLHYFESKEELFVEILRKRDATDQARMAPPAEPGGIPDMRGGFVQVMRHNADVPGLVQLYARLSVEATDPEHPAHDYFIERTRALRETIAATVEGGADTGGLSATTYARVLQALADGLQVQWLLEPDLDMASVIEEFLGALENGRADASTHPAGESA
jgi:AcrR family transcriptional regulator